MLRGINVSGHKSIRMERLRESFEALEFTNVRTYVQSGNVVFEAGKDSAAGLAEEIQKKILQDVGFPVSALVRTSKEMERVIRSNPFLKETGVDIPSCTSLSCRKQRPKRRKRV
jgi:uncharacterized protein (DUF1697 family)